ncbi:hypothetical protein ACVRXB_08940 [Streptococcus pantholopis]
MRFVGLNQTCYDLRKRIATTTLFAELDSGQCGYFYVLEESVTG